MDRTAQANFNFGTVGKAGGSAWAAVVVLDYFLNLGMPNQVFAGAVVLVGALFAYVGPFLPRRA